MSDFGAIPPEITSARIYSGPGSAPMMVAATAWDALAGQLESFAGSYSSVISELQEYQWSGSSSTAMASAAAPYVAWAAATAAQAQRVATQARAAAASYDTALAATVPPPVVAANRTQLAILVMTNFLGQNTALIAAVEAAYLEMWAQDAAAMFGYAASSAAAIEIAPFNEPPPTTTAGHSGVAASAGTSGSSTSVPPLLQTALSDFAALSGPADMVSASARTAAVAGDFINEVNLYGFQAGNVAAAAPVPGTTTGAVTTGGHGGVLAQVGRAESVGRLSIPQSWAATTTAAGPADRPAQLQRTTFRALPAWATTSTANVSDGTPGSGLGPPARLPARPVRNTARRMQVRHYRIPRPAVGG